MLKHVMQLLDERLLFPYRYSKLTERLLPLLDEVTSILDVGTGDGHLAHHVMQTTGCPVIGLDVCLQPHPYIEIHHYDGNHFPFEDNAFDCVMMVDMLHHTTNINQMIAEACRVARRYVVIKDHFWQTRIDLMTLHAADYLGNIPYNVPLPYNYLQHEEWLALFTQHGLEAVSSSTFKYSRLEPAHHIMVKLQVEPAAVNGSAQGREAAFHDPAPELIDILP